MNAQLKEQPVPHSTLEPATNPKNPGKHTLSYVRRALKAKDGQDGYLFLHCWATGFQYLIFQTLKGTTTWLDAVAAPKAQYP